MVSCRTLFTGLLVLVAGSTYGQSQVNRYMVFFTDKDNTPYSISAPEEYLSERALLRREKQDIEVNQDDLPVDAAYVAALGELADVFFTTKWFNGALVQARSVDIPDVEALDFVSSVELVAPGEVLTVVREAMPDLGAVLLADTTGRSTNFQNDLLGGDEMHAEGFRGQGMLIAVMDGGFRGVHEYEVFRHLFNEERLVAARDFVTDSYNPFQFSGHGTGVLSCIAGYRSEQLKGLAHKSDFVLFVTEEVATEYRIEEYNWLFAAEMADSMGVDIINTSLGYTDFDLASMNYTYAAMDGQTTVISRASEMAFERGMFLVTSNGNLGNSSWQFVSAPADAPNVLSVGAISANLNKTSFSSIGPTSDNRIKPDVSALGQDVTVFSGTAFTLSNGTSFASPLVAGLVAGLWQQHPDWSNERLLSAIRQSASRAADPNNLLGYGIPNFRLDESVEVLTVEKPKQDIVIYPNPVTSGLLTIDFRASEFEIKSGHVINTYGQVLAAFEERSGSDLVQLDLSTLSSGLYYLKLVGRNDSQMLKVIKR